MLLAAVESLAGVDGWMAWCLGLKSKVHLSLGIFIGLAVYPQALGH